MLKATSSIVNVSQITGVLPVVNGGTGVTTSTGTGSTVLSAAPTLSGNVTLSTGNLIVASGQGIDFSATPGIGTSELLNDYEEGVWTPAYAPTTGAFTSISYGFAQAQYVKIGSLVFVSWRIRTSALTVGTGAGAVQITGLPFTAGGISVEFALGIGTGFAVTDAACAKVEGSTAYMILFQERNNVSIQVTDLSTGAANNFTSGFVCYSVV